MSIQEIKPRSAPGAAPAPLIPLLDSSPWQMSFGERAALEGVLSQLEPRLAVELGTAEGGSLETLARHSEEVHSFDLVAPSLPVAESDHVHLHSGDSHELLARVLAAFEEQGRNVDFALVDGDHSEDGVRRDVEDLLASPALGRTIMLIHDTMNETVRRGLERVRFDGYPKVAYVELDFVAGQLFREPTIKNEMWGGLGLVVCDATRSAYFRPPPYQQRYYETFQLVRAARVRMGLSATSLELGAEGFVGQQAELVSLRRSIESVSALMSWRLPAPLRRLGNRARAADSSNGEGDR